MKEQELLFYKEYEEFYSMAEKSEVFGRFCQEALGGDFSQDGFSDIRQIDRILKYVPQNKDICLLDIGCGNGKMLGYLQEKTSAHIYGFDYSDNGISQAKELFPDNSDFRQGVIGAVDYPDCSFELVISMDSMYFAEDMVRFVTQIWKWLREDGVFFCGYQEGDVMPRTGSCDTTELAKAFQKNGIEYEVEDITQECYGLLRRKRETARRLETLFLEAGESRWYNMLMGQTESAQKDWEAFSKEMARYIYVARKGR